MPNFSNYKVKDKCSICPLIRCKIRCGSAPIFHLKIRSGSVHQLVDFGAKTGSVTNPKATTKAASKSTVFWTGRKSRDNILIALDIFENHKVLGTHHITLLLWPVQNTVLLDAATVLAFGLVTDPYFAPKSTNWYEFSKELKWSYNAVFALFWAYLTFDKFLYSFHTNIT